MAQKERLDTALVRLGLAESREKAKALIMAGQVYVNGQKAAKSGDSLKEDDAVEVRGEKMPFVSRGGFKLQKAVAAFGLSLNGCVCMDVGASTGGFTDCMLQHGAKKVYAIDVGYGQLAWSLRNDARVINMERTNFRFVTHAQVPEEIDFASVDVAFISLRLILPALHDLLRENGQAVCLIKPQFEAGREHVGKKGVVRDRAVHAAVVQSAVDFSLSQGFTVLHLDYSPIKGPQGNIEYLIHLEKTAAPQSFLAEDAAAAVVAASHDALDKGAAE